MSDDIIGQQSPTPDSIVQATPQDNGGDTQTLAQQLDVANTQQIPTPNTAASPNAGEGGDGGGEGGVLDDISYDDFSLPDGVELSTDTLDQAKTVFKELGLNQEQAQKLVDIQSGFVEKMAENQINAYNQQLEQWTSQSKNDAEFGGEKFEQSVAVAKLAVDKFGSEQFQEVLRDYGLGSHPEVIRFMVNVGKSLSEDIPPDGGSVPIQGKSRSDIMYSQN